MTVKRHLVFPESLAKSFTWKALFISFLKTPVWTCNMAASATLQKFISMESFYSQSRYNMKKEWVFRSVRRFLALPDCVQKWFDAGPAGLNQPETRAPVVQSRACSSLLGCLRDLGKLVAVVQLLSHVQLFVTPWTAACQACLNFTISWSLLKLMSIELVMLSNHFILCHPLLFLPSIFPNNNSGKYKAPLGGIKHMKKHVLFLDMKIQSWKYINC